MSRRRGNITARSPGSFRLRYDIGGDPVTGKRRMATATVRGTRKDAERELTRLLRTVDTNEHVDSNRMTVGAWLAHWLDTVRAEVSPKTHERYAEIIKSYLIPAFGKIALVKLTPTAVVELNRAVAVGFADGPQAGLDLLSPLLHDPALERYQPLHAAHAELLKRAGEREGAARAYEAAIELSANAVERAELERRLQDL